MIPVLAHDPTRLGYIMIEFDNSVALFSEREEDGTKEFDLFCANVLNRIKSKAV
jgi:hypothetical protein